MKKLSLVGLVTLVVCSRSFAQGLLLNAGDAFTYEFNSFSFCCAGLPMPAGAIATFGLSGLGVGDMLRFEAFEGSLSESPIFSSTFALTQGYHLYPADMGLAWQDLQGVVRFTMDSGSASLDYMQARVTFPDTEVFLQVVPVPEPTLPCLFALGGLCWLVWRRRVRRDSFRK